MQSHKTDDQMKKLVKESLEQMVEVLDNHIPIVGSLMDLPIIDALEKSAVDNIVDIAWQISLDIHDCTYIHDDPTAFVSA